LSKIRPCLRRRRGHTQLADRLGLLDSLARDVVPRPQLVDPQDERISLDGSTTAPRKRDACADATVRAQDGDPFERMEFALAAARAPHAFGRGAGRASCQTDLRLCDVMSWFSV
jgi:hypothetical protein